MRGEHQPGKAFWLGLGLTAIATALTLRQRQRARSASPLRQVCPTRTALVTGASSGIGASYARRLAQEGYNLILVARRTARLQALADELTHRYNVQAEVCVADLANPADVAKVEARIVACDNLALLVNNAGFSTPGDFVDNEVTGQEMMIHVNVIAPVRLTRAALPAMLARHCGAIVNVSSLTAFFAISGSTTYSATKAFLKNFSEALSQELQGSGVRVLALCPGFTRTEFQQVNHIDRVGIPDFVWMSPEAVVAQSLRDLESDRVVSVPGAGYRLLTILHKVIPYPLLYHIECWLGRYRARSEAETPSGPAGRLPEA